MSEATELTLSETVSKPNNQMCDQPDDQPFIEGLQCSHLPETSVNL
jgi:hypothetical protein